MEVAETFYLINLKQDVCTSSKKAKVNRVKLSIHGMSSTSYSYVRSNVIANDEQVLLYKYMDTCVAEPRLHVKNEYDLNCGTLYKAIMHKLHTPLTINYHTDIHKSVELDIYSGRTILFIALGVFVSP